MSQKRDLLSDMSQKRDLLSDIVSQKHELLSDCQKCDGHIYKVTFVFIPWVAMCK